MMFLREEFATKDAMMFFLGFVNSFFVPNHVMTFGKAAVTKGTSDKIRRTSG